MPEKSVTLVSYMDLSRMFPLLTSSDDNWAKVLRRWREKGNLKEGKHFKLQYFGHLRYMYSLRSVVMLICQQARKDMPLPTALYLYQTYLDQFCKILDPPAEQADAAVPANSVDIKG